MKAYGSFMLDQVHRLVNSTLCLGAFAFLALALTIIAVGYQPSDPWLQPSKSMTKVFNSLHNATFDSEGAVLVTGEDVMSPLSPTSSAVESTEILSVVVTGVCDLSKEAINCSDPSVFAAIEIANRKKFPDIERFEYQNPVQGSSEKKCDISWQFKSKKEKSKRMYRDWREYKLIVNRSCDYEVEKIGKWHSGRNARPVGAEMDANDTIPTTARAANTFWNGKYLYYSRSGDYCKGMSQYMWSFLCALGEAQYLNRTLVVDLDFCLSARDNPGHPDEPGKDLRFYIDFEHLQAAASVVEQKQFLKRWINWNKKHPQNLISYKVVGDFRTSPMQLLEENSSTVLWRKFEEAEPNNYWYRVCEGESEKVIQRPWHAIWKSKRLMNIVNSICGKMDWDFDSVHVVRGKKAENQNLWPNLEKDTRPEMLLKKLNGEIDEGRKVYIATNEKLEGYFDHLRTKYRIFLLDDYRYLWDTGSEWYNETSKLIKKTSSSSSSPNLEFDAYMRAAVDSEVFLRAKRRIETFGMLTSDCKHGINTCT